MDELEQGGKLSEQSLLLQSRELRRRLGGLCLLWEWFERRPLAGVFHRLEHYAAFGHRAQRYRRPPRKWLQRIHRQHSLRQAPAACGLYPADDCGHSEWLGHLSNAPVQWHNQRLLEYFCWQRGLLAALARHARPLFPATGGEVAGFSATFVPIPGESYRRPLPAYYINNSIPVCAPYPEEASISVCTQSLLAGGDYATAITTEPIPPSFGWGSGAFLTLFHIANDWPASTSGGTAGALVAAQAAASLASPSAWASMISEHTAWWSAWWPTSFLSIPDTAMEGMYVLQMFKYASTAREGGKAIDLMGPWWQPSGWQEYWWDMNVPVTYWALYTAERFDIASTLIDMLTVNITQLFANVEPQPLYSDALGFGAITSFDMVGSETVSPGIMLGHVPWILHNMYMHASYMANDTLARDVLFPLLRGSINIYRHFSWINETDGSIHLPATSSPEYPYPHGPTNDTHYDLSLFMWGCRTLLELSATYHLDDPLVPWWATVLQHLTPYPTDPEHGYSISLGVGFDVPHRHFSHLFALYPLHLTVWDPLDGGTNASQHLFQISLDRWTGLTCGGGHCPNGFTYDGAASISALAGSTDESRRVAAVGNISNFIRSGMMNAATLYAEGNQPCMESPLGSANALQEILLQSWGGRVRVFPAVPLTWPNVTIYNLAAAGGLRISAVCEETATLWISVEAVDYTGTGAGLNRSVVLAPRNMLPPFSSSPSNIAFSLLPSGDVNISLPIGSTVYLFPTAAEGPGGIPPPFIIAPLVGNASEYNYWGKH